MKLRETLLNPNESKYFDLNFAAEDGTVAAQTEALYMMLAEIIRWQRAHPKRVEFDFEYMGPGYQVLTVEEAAAGLISVTQKSTGTRHVIQEWIQKDVPLALAGQLVQEDFCILKKKEPEG